MITIQGAITLTSPLHTSAGYQGLRITTKGVVTSKDSEGLPVVSTMTTPLTVHGRYFGQVPIFPSSGVIGALRRFAAQRLRTALLHDGKRLSVAAYQALTHGQPASTQLGSVATLESYEAVRAHPFFGLFGGATLRNSAAFSVSDLNPIFDATVQASLVPQRYADLAPNAHHQIEPHHLLITRVVRKIDNLRRGRDPLQGQDLELAEYNSDSKTESAAAYQIVPAGTSFFVRIRVQPNTTEVQRGLLLLALSDWVAQAQIGARAHLGWGAFTAQRFRYIDGAERHDLFSAQEDDEGITTMECSPQFHALTAPALEFLQDTQKAPQSARDTIAQLLAA